MKKVSMIITGSDENIFNVFNRFRRQAKKEGWLDSEIKQVINKAMDGNYRHALNTIQEHCE